KLCSFHSLGPSKQWEISLLGNQQAHDIESHRVLPSIDVTVQDVDVKVSALTQTTNNFFGHCHRAVMANGASNANRYEILDVIVNVTGQTQTTNKFLGHCHRAVIATGASNANRYEILALMAVSIQHGFQHDQEILNKGFCSILA